MHEINDIITTSVENSLDCAAYPDSNIEISITVVCDNGSLACCAINATILALFDAGLKLKQRVSSSCFAIKDDAILIDPLKREEEISDGVVTFAYSHHDHNVFSTYFQGSIKPSLMIAALSNATCNQEMFEKYFQ
ncbi:exosome complex component RRP46 [Histomonas meleagridis]|uniref:exosome complex component RRP46 n=1 Tax=Histomonas meleagridis TaxID=135588 RepID=UPI00355A644C|nr:exosome complex component RRP46 [Histomonas meleagridis]KAH0797443.1 exosome complex component RRP46 [Histomonas meleagridis]